MITLNQTKQKQANEVDGHEALHIERTCQNISGRRILSWKLTGS